MATPKEAVQNGNTDDGMRDADMMDERPEGANGEVDGEVDGEANGEADGEEANGNGQEQQGQQRQGQQQQDQEAVPPPAGPRAARLQELFATTLARTLTRVSWDNFAACYPTAAAAAAATTTTRSPAALRTVHAALVRRLGELCAAEFAVVMRQRQVVRRLNELEELGRAARERREASGGGQQARSPPAPPHTLPPAVVLDAHLAPQRRAQAADLADRLLRSHQANAARFARLAAQQHEADRLAAPLERALADADTAAGLLDAGDTNDGTMLVELARETRSAESEMAGV